MSGCPDFLTCRPLTKNEAVDFSNASFGGESYQMELNDWLKNESESFLKNGKGILWGFFNQDQVLIGFAAFGLDHWHFPDGTKVLLHLIHTLAIETKFQGKPENTERRCKYSRQLMGHLIKEAERNNLITDVLGLLVHPQNFRAIRLYQEHGFVDLKADEIDRHSGQKYHRFARFV